MRMEIKNDNLSNFEQQTIFNPITPSEYENVPTAKNYSHFILRDLCQDVIDAKTDRKEDFLQLVFDYVGNVNEESSDGMRLKAQNYRMFFMDSKLARQVIDTCSLDLSCELMRSAIAIHGDTPVPYQFPQRLAITDFCTNSILGLKYTGPTPDQFVSRVFQRGMENAKLSLTEIWELMGYQSENPIHFQIQSALILRELADNHSKPIHDRFLQLFSAETIQNAKWSTNPDVLRSKYTIASDLLAKLNGAEVEELLTALPSSAVPMVKMILAGISQEDFASIYSQQSMTLESFDYHSMLNLCKEHIQHGDEHFGKLEPYFIRAFSDAIQMDLEQLNSCNLLAYPEALRFNNSTVKCLNSAAIPLNTRIQIAENVAHFRLPPEWVLALSETFLKHLNPVKIEKWALNLKTPSTSRFNLPSAQHTPAKNEKLNNWLTLKSYSECITQCRSNDHVAEKINGISWLVHVHLTELKSNKDDYNSIISIEDIINSELKTEVLYRVGSMLSPSEQAASVERVFNNQFRSVKKIKSSSIKNEVDLLKETVMALVRPTEENELLPDGPLAKTISKLLGDIVDDRQIWGNQLFRGLDAICSFCNWSHVDFISVIDKWLNEGGSNQSKRGFDMRLNDLTKAGFDRNILLDIPFNSEMSTYLINTKLYAHKNVHESRKKFMRPREEDVRKQMSQSFFTLINDDTLMVHADLAVNEWRTADMEFVLKFIKFLETQDLDRDVDFNRCCIALTSLSDCTIDGDESISKLTTSFFDIFMDHYQGDHQDYTAVTKLIEFVKELRQLNVPLTPSGLDKYRHVVRTHDLVDENDIDLRTQVLLQAQKLGSHNAGNYLKRTRLSISSEEQDAAVNGLIKYCLTNESGESVFSILKIKPIDHEFVNFQSAATNTIDSYQAAFKCDTFQRYTAQLRSMRDQMGAMLTLEPYINYMNRSSLNYFGKIVAQMPSEWFHSAEVQNVRDKMKKREQDLAKGSSVPEEDTSSGAQLVATLADTKKPMVDRFIALDQIFAFHRADMTAETFSDIITSRGFLTGLKRFNLLTPFLYRARDDISTAVKLEIIQMLAGNIYQMSELNALCFDMLSKDDDVSELWPVLITRYNNCLTKETSASDVQQSLREILNYYGEDCASRIEQAHASKGIDTDIFIPFVFLPQIEDQISGSDLENVLSQNMKVDRDIYHSIPTEQKEYWQIFFNLIDRGLLYYARGIVTCIDDSFESIISIISTYLMECNFSDKKTLESCITITKTVDTIIKNKNSYWDMAITSLISNKTTHPQIVIKFVQQLRKSGTQLPAKARTNYRYYLQANKVLDFDDNDLRTFIASEIELKDVGKGLQLLKMVTSFPNRYQPGSAIDPNQFALGNVCDDAFDRALGTLMDYSLKRNGEDIQRIVAYRWQKTAHYCYPVDQLDSILKSLQTDGDSRQRNRTEPKVAFDFVTRYNWPRNTTPVELELLQETIGPIVADEINRQLRRVKRPKDLFEKLLTLQRMHPDQAEINNCILRKRLGADRTRGVELVILFCDQSTRPFYVKELIEYFDSSMPTLIHICAKMLNSSTVEAALDKSFILQNLAEVYFHVLSGGREYLTLDDYEYLKDRFELFYSLTPHELCHQVTDRLLYNAIMSNDVNLVSRIIQFIQKIGRPRGVTFDESTIRRLKLLDINEDVYRFLQHQFRFQTNERPQNTAQLS